MRFVDATIDRQDIQSTAANMPTTVIDSRPAIFKDVPAFSRSTNAATESLADILLDQLKRAREGQVRKYASMRENIITWFMTAAS